MSVDAARAAGLEPPTGTIVSTALSICRRHWRPLLLYALLAGLPVAVLDAAIALERGTDPFATPLGGADPVRRPESGLASWGSTVIGLALYGLASAASVHVVAAAHDGRSTHWRDGLAMGLRRLGGVVVTSIIVLLVVFAGILALVAPGIWIAVALSLATPALVLENLSPVAALKRSFALVRNRWWRTAGVLAVGILIVLGAVVAVSIPVGLIAASTDDASVRAALAAAANAVGSGLLVPLTIAPLTVLFLERRRSEEAAGSEPRAEAESYRGFAPPTAPARPEDPEPRPHAD